MKTGNVDLFIRNFKGCEIQVWQNRDGWYFLVKKLDRTQSTKESWAANKESAIRIAKQYAEKGW